jgi:DNA gyrase subunit A
MAIRFHEAEIRAMGRGAAGVKAISLRPGDYVIEMDVLPETPEGAARAAKRAQAGVEESDADAVLETLETIETIEPAETAEEVVEGEDVTIAADDAVYGQILTVTERGFGKRTPVRLYRLTSRGAQGVSNIRITEKNGKVAGAAHVQEGDQLLLITEQGMMIRVSCDGIRSMSRNTQGVRIINIDEGDTVVAAVKVVEREQPEGDETDITDEGSEDGADSEPETDDSIH